jgi:hypothetical protein
MHAISHQTDWVVSAWVHMLLFLMPGLAFALAFRAKPEAQRTVQPRMQSSVVRPATFVAPYGWVNAGRSPIRTA